MERQPIPRRRYLRGPSPIQELCAFSRELGGPRVFVKRDDTIGFAGGGNKVRKLEYVVADALRRGADTLITTGAVQSNHCRLTLAAAVREGMRCRLVLEERVAGSYSPLASGNNLLYELMGAEHVRVVAGGTDLLAAMEAEAEAVRRRGGVPYLIPGGASDPLGALGYVGCAREIVWQCHDLDLRFDRIVCASGSGGTQAGLLAGLRDLGIGVAVTGINVSRPRAVQEERVRALASGTLELMGSAEGMPRELVVCLEDWVGPGYSLPTPEMVEAVRLLARTEAVMLDPVYTGKAMAGLIGLARSGQMGSEENVLFLHTGGFAGLFAAPETFLDASSLARTVTVREASRRIAAVAASAC